MPKILLLQMNRDYATSLADAVTSLPTEYSIDISVGGSFKDRVSRLVDREYDLVQTDELIANGILATGGSIFPGTPFVVTIRGWGDYTNAHGQYSLPRYASIWFRSNISIKKANSLIFISEYTREVMANRFSINRSAIAGRPIGIYKYQDGSGVMDDGFNLLTVTNLRYEEKFRGVKTILRGLNPLLEKYGELQYSIAGDGRHLQALREFVEKYPHTDQINVLGFRDDVPDLLAGADAFVYVSFLDALPTAILEAQAAGLPVVGGNASGVPEAVGDAGDVCPPTPTGVGDAIERVIDDDQHRQQLANKSIQKMEDYNKRCANDHIAAWDRVLGRE